MLINCFEVIREGNIANQEEQYLLWNLLLHFALRFRKLDFQQREEDKKRNEITPFINIGKRSNYMLKKIGEALRCLRKAKQELLHRLY